MRAGTRLVLHAEGVTTDTVVLAKILIDENGLYYSEDVEKGDIRGGRMTSNKSNIVKPTKKKASGAGSKSVEGGYR
jgi:hypothetical protein